MVWRMAAGTERDRSTLWRGGDGGAAGDRGRSAQAEGGVRWQGGPHSPLAQRGGASRRAHRGMGGPGAADGLAGGSQHPLQEGPDAPPVGS